MTNVLDIVELAIDPEKPQFTKDGIFFEVTWKDEAVRKVKLIARSDREGLRELAYDLVTTCLSETTNNDACDVSIRERSAHFSFHDDLNSYAVSDLTSVVIDAEVLDELS